VIERLDGKEVFGCGFCRWSGNSGSIRNHIAPPGTGR
jgi:hypothetical protein